MCAIAALGLNYLYRFDIAGEALDWKDSTGYLGGGYLIYSHKVGPKVQMTPAAYYMRSNDPINIVKHLKEVHELKTSKAGHMKRKRGRVKQGENNVESKQQDQSGRWYTLFITIRFTEASSGTKSYADVPWESVMVLANHPKEVGSFYLSRAQSDPPMALQKQIFPWIEDVREKIKVGLLPDLITHDLVLKVTVYLKIAF